MRVIIGGYHHETNTFSSERTSLASFNVEGAYSGIYIGEESVTHYQGSRTVMGGFINAAEKYGFEVVPTIYAAAMPSGIVEKPAFEYLENNLTTRIRAEKTIDGILLHMHGAMVAEEYDDPEGHTLKRIRSLVGDQIPIVIVNDLHGNISPLMVEYADVLIGYKTSPHIDYYERGFEAGSVMASIIAGVVKPTAVLKKPPILAASKKTDTTIVPLCVLMALAHEMEKEKAVVNVSVNTGFCSADVPQAGLGIVVTTNNNLQLAEEKAALLEQVAWALRKAFIADLPTAEEAINHVIQAQKGPIILADQNDNASGGGPADGTILLKGLLEAGQEAIGALHDPEAVEQAIKAGVGATLVLRIGGKKDNFHGTPIVASGRVKLIADITFPSQYIRGLTINMGRTVVFQTETIEIVLSEHKVQQVEPLIFRSVGIDPSTKKAVVVKNGQAFAVLFAPFAKEILYVNAPGICGNINSLSYYKVRRPIIPLDDV